VRDRRAGSKRAASARDFPIPKLLPSGLPISRLSIWFGVFFGVFTLAVMHMTCSITVIPARITEAGALDREANPGCEDRLRLPSMALDTDEAFTAFDSPIR